MDYRDKREACVCQSVFSQQRRELKLGGHLILLWALQILLRHVILLCTDELELFMYRCTCVTWNINQDCRQLEHMLMPIHWYFFQGQFICLSVHSLSLWCCFLSFSFPATASDEHNVFRLSFHRLTIHLSVLSHQHKIAEERKLRNVFSRDSHVHAY